MLRTGDAFWVDDVPPLDGGEPKRRPVVVLMLDDLRPPFDSSCEVAVGATTSDEEESVDEDAIWVERELPTPCWLLPRWVLEVNRVRLTESAGRISDPLLERLITAVVDRHWRAEGGP